MESWKLGKLKNSKLRLAKEKFQSLKYARKFWNFESFIFWFFVYSCRSFKLNCRQALLIQGRVGLSSSFIVLFLQRSLWCFSFLPLFALVLLSDSSSYELFIMQLNNEPKYFAIFTSSLTLSGVQGFCSRSLETGCAFWRSWRHFHLRLFLHPNERQSHAGSGLSKRHYSLGCCIVHTDLITVYVLIHTL